MRKGWTRMSKRQWYNAGGFRRSWLCRKMVGRSWTYWSVGSD